MRLVKSSQKDNPRWGLADMFCPKCYPHKECGFVDCGLIRDGDVIEWAHSFGDTACGHKWVETISI